MSQVKRIGIRVKNIYMLEVDGCTSMMGKEEKVVSQDEGELWHMRLGHIHHGSLKIMHQISIGLPIGTLSPLDRCKGFTMGKYVKYTFHEKENPASVILERIHTDVCGPFSVASTKNISIMLFLWMNFLINAESSLWRRRIKHSQISVSLNHWWIKSRGSK
jgi:hypothetical protein